MPFIDAAGLTLRYDLRGHGLSDVAQGPCTLADLAADALALPMYRVTTTGTCSEVSRHSAPVGARTAAAAIQSQI